MRSHRRTRWFVLLPLVAITTGALTAARSSPPMSSCQSAANWASAHRGELPQTYAEIIRYPTGYRRAIQEQLALSVRREMWRTQYRVYAESGLLDAAQRVFMAKIEGTLVEMFNERTKQVRREQLGDSISSVAVTVLGRDLTRKIFFQLGPEDAERVPSYFHLASNNRRGLPNLPAETNCTCHYGVPRPECTALQECKESSCTANSGCGTDGLYSCNGMCGGGET